MSTPRVASIALVFPLAIAAACASAERDAPLVGPSEPPPSAAEADASTPTSAPDDDASPAPAPSPSDDPFAPQPDTSEGLTNVGADVSAILEHGALAGACASYQAGVSDRKAMLLCGKAMFFYEGFGTSGVPVAFAKFLVANFPSEIGAGFSKLGMIEDPTSTDHYPLGLAPGAKLGTIDTLAFTCASCHFAELPDRRFAVGAANHAFDYGALNLALAVFPTVAAGVSQPSAHDPDALKKIQPLLDEVTANPSLKTSLLLAMLPLLGSAGSAPTFPASAEHLYASWKTGTMDFFIAPLPFDDHMHTISKISALWGMATEQEIQRCGMNGAMLGWTGSTASLLNFARGFVDLGGGRIADWPDVKLAPLVAYVESLRAPVNPATPDAALVAKGRDLFTSKGCIDCHGAPRGAGKSVYTYEAIGTDPAMKLWCDPDQTGAPEYGIRFQPGDALTHGIKSPRLVGLWAMQRFLHDGAVATLEDLFCTSGPRGGVTALAYGDQGHDYTCRGLTAEEKRALIAFLRTH